MWRLVSLNLNGIRSASNKGWTEWVEQMAPDCMGVQEVRAQMTDIQGRFDTLGPLQGYFHCAQKKGYAGVGTYTKKTPSDVCMGFGVEEFDAEGRYIETRFDTSAQKLSIINIYFPSGSSSESRQEAKFRFLEAIYPHLQRLKEYRDFIVIGDINIAHKEIDLKNWRSNQKNSGFLPAERAWMDQVITQLGLVDVFRQLNPAPDQYTWWSNRGQAWSKNVGWRIDYHLATPRLAALAKQAEIFKAIRFSDHAPLIIDYDLKL